VTPPKENSAGKVTVILPPDRNTLCGYNLNVIVVVVPTTVELLAMLPKVIAAATDDTPYNPALISSITLLAVVIV
jgi:hypothetical protein